ncbi:MAG: hypothetical protein LBJ38_02495 [Oscillospiraceae bacterium]|nr:hypothetical protein [Oscillospiraceae bacterium]
MESKKVRKVAVLFLALLGMVAFGSNGKAVPPPGDVTFVAYTVKSDDGEHCVVHPHPLVAVQNKNGQQFCTVAVAGEVDVEIFPGLQLVTDLGRGRVALLRAGTGIRYGATPGWEAETITRSVCLDQQPPLPFPGNVVGLRVTRHTVAAAELRVEIRGANQNQQQLYFIRFERQ